MYCRDCGAKLSLRFLENEGLIPYCERCGAFKFPYFPVAVSMTVVNRQENKILLARHTGEQDYKLFAGYIKKGETAEKAEPAFPSPGANALEEGVLPKKRRKQKAAADEGQKADDSAHDDRPERERQK